MLVKLASTIDVAAEDVSEVTINCNQRVEVLMRSGRVHTIPADYKATVYDTHTRIVGMINVARLQRTPIVVVGGVGAPDLAELGSVVLRSDASPEETGALLKAGAAPAAAGVSRT